MSLSALLALMAGIFPVQEEVPEGTPVEAGAAERVALEEGPLWREVESAEQLTQELKALAALYPRYVDLRLLQPDRDAKPLQLLVLGEREVGDPSKRPGLLVMPELGIADQRSTSILLAVAKNICRELDGERSMSSVLERTTLYVIPAPLAEGYFLSDEEKGPRLVDLKRNFPSGWRPTGSGTAGPYPLSEPECHALADFLHWRSNLAACLEISSDSPFLAGGESLLGAEERAYSAKFASVLSSLGAEEPVLFGLDVLAAGPGSLRRYADGDLGLWCFLEAPSNAAVADAFRSSEVLLAESALIAAHSLFERVVGLAGALPRLEVGTVEVEPLGEDLWRIDVPIRNAGSLTTGARHRPEPTARIRLELEGAVFAATMVRDQAGAAFAPLASSGQRVDLGHLTGGETLIFRAIVKAPAGSMLDLRVRAARAGNLTARVALPE